MKKKTFEKACESYFKRGHDQWSKFFNKWESKAADEEIEIENDENEEIPTYIDDDDNNAKSLSRKRKSGHFNLRKSPQKKKKFGEVEKFVGDDDDEEYNHPEAEESNLEITEIEEEEETTTVAIDFTGNNLDMFSYLSELSRQFANKTPFCANDDFSRLNNSLTEQSYSTDITPFTRHYDPPVYRPLPSVYDSTNPYFSPYPSKVYAQRLYDLGNTSYGNLNFAPNSPLLYSRMSSRFYNNSLACSTPVRPNRQLSLTYPGNVLSPIQSSLSNTSALTIIESDDDDDDVVVEPMKNMKPASPVKKVDDDLEASCSDEDIL